MGERNSAYACRTFKRDKYAWYVLIFFVLALVWGVGAFRENDRVQLRPWESSVSNRATITVLEFDRVVLEKSKNHIYHKDLRKQLKALKENGFEAVTVTDIFKFYNEDKKLPEKSVLLIFANGYLETYATVDPILREMRWPAAMTVITETLVNRETFFLYWDRLRRMVKSGVWSLVSAGHRRREEISNAKSNVSEAILTDYKVSRDLVEANIPGYKMLAYSSIFYKARNYIKKFDGEDSDERALKKIYPLRFMNSFVGVNDKSSDPFRLRRLRVKPGWKPETLLTLINQGIQAVTADGAKPSLAESIWFREDGEWVDTSSHRKYPPRQNTRLTRVPDSEQGTRLHGVPGAGIFFPGNNRVVNWVLEADIRLDRGEFWIRQDSFKTGDGWRIGGNSQNINVQVRVANGQYENLASSRAGITLDEWHHLRLVKRGKGIMVNWDGRPLWGLPVSAPNQINGDIEFWAWSEEGEGSLSLSDARISFFPDDIRWLETYPKENDIQLLIKYTEKISGVTTITHTVQGNQTDAVAFDKDLFQIISHRYGWDFIPTLRVLPQKQPSGKPDSGYGGKYENGDTEILSISKIKNLVKQNHWTHVHLDLSRLGGERKNGWFSQIAELNHELEKINCRLLVTTEGRPDVSQSLKFRLPLLKNDSKSNWPVAERSH